MTEAVPESQPKLPPAHHHKHTGQLPEPIPEPESIPEMPPESPPAERSTLGDKIGNELTAPPEIPEETSQTDEPLGLDFQIPSTLPIPVSQADKYQFEDWKLVTNHPIFGFSAYPIIELPHVGKFRLTGGFMEHYGHGRKHWDYDVIMPDGKVTKVGPSKKGKKRKGSGRFNIGIDYVVLDPQKRVNTWYGGEVITTVKAQKNDTEYGNRVVVRTNQTYRYKGKDYPVYQAYSHLESYNVKKGDKVSQGQAIAVMGKTGGTTQDHVDLRTFIIPRDTFAYTLRIPGQPGWMELSLNALEDQLKSRTRVAINQ